VHRAKAENLEIESCRSFIPNRKGMVRLLAYASRANMRSCREAIDSFSEPGENGFPFGDGS